MQQQFQPEATNAPQTVPIIAEVTPATTAEGTTAQNFQTVTERLTEVQQKTRQQKVRFWTAFILLESVVLLPAFKRLLFPGPHSELFQTVSFCSTILAILGLLTVFVLQVRKKPRWNAEELAQVGGVNAIPALLNILDVPGLPHSRQSTYPALIRLLPQLKASDSPLLDRSHRRLLNRMLRLGAAFPADDKMGGSLRIAVLQGLEQAGDATAIPAVERLAKLHARTPEQQRVKQAAIECLAALRVHSGELDATRTLLRASNPGEAAPETLLRPAASSAETAPHQLLRAAHSEEDAKR